VVEWVEFEGPLNEEWPPKRTPISIWRPAFAPAESGPIRRKICGWFPSNPEADARRLLERFLTCVFRRPAKDTEIEEHVRFAMEKIRLGKPFDEALRSAYKLALCAPEFLFWMSNPALSLDNAIASRLSYALWGSSPDEALRSIAEQGQTP